MKSIITILSCWFLFSSQVFGQTISDKPKRTNFGLGLSVGLGLAVSPSNNFKIDNVPLELRQIPSHPNDGWIYGSKQVIRTIPYDLMNISHNSEGLKVSFSPELTIWRFRLRNGASLYNAADTDGPMRSNEGNTREINQFGKPTRGYGTSLVYYSIYGKKSSKFGWSGGADFDIGKGLLIMAGYDRWNNYYNILAESGYDRWNSLEKYKDYDLGKLSLNRRYVGFGWQPDVDNYRLPLVISVVGGKTNSIFRPTELGKNITFERNKNWFVEFGLSVHLVLLKK